MLDMYVGDMPLMPCVLLFSLILVFLQLFLCFRVRSLLARLAPVLLVLAGAAALVLAGLAFTGFERLGFFTLALLLVLPLAACGVSWLIWGLAQTRSKR